MPRRTGRSIRSSGAQPRSRAAVPRVLIELPLRDGRVARVSHDPAFAPTLPPCLLRRALVTPLRPDWLRAASGVDMGGPFVDVDPQVPPGVVSFYDGPTANATFATACPPCLIAAWLHTADPPLVDTSLIDGRISVDTALGTSLVCLRSNALDPTQLVSVAQWIIQHTSSGPFATS